MKFFDLVVVAWWSRACGRRVMSSSPSNACKGLMHIKSVGGLSPSLTLIVVSEYRGRCEKLLGFINIRTINNTGAIGGMPKGTELSRKELAKDLVVLNHVQVPKRKPEPAPHLQTITSFLRVDSE
ncbi:hypothetical protein TNCV_2194711 [Trichonephila clavipes]|uniref:Uncharacterized protein n=1 Tax=Trichonephila clavipes TaxID=2585209 RepID=A0A8X6SGA5_TRICX|nr:hypothetical protein TNCV_2194711 [Trichonephila clavipes]